MHAPLAWPPTLAYKHLLLCQYVLCALCCAAPSSTHPTVPLEHGFLPRQPLRFQGGRVLDDSRELFDEPITAELSGPLSLFQPLGRHFKFHLGKRTRAVTSSSGRSVQKNKEKVLSGQLCCYQVLEGANLSL